MKTSDKTIRLIAALAIVIVMAVFIKLYWRPAGVWSVFYFTLPIVVVTIGLTMWWSKRNGAGVRK